MRAFLPRRAQAVEKLLSAVSSVARVGMPVPVAYHEESEYHAAEVCDMGNAVACGTDGREQLDGGIADDEPLGLDGNGQGEDEDALFGENHAEGQQDGIDGTRGPYGGPLAEHGGTVVRYGRDLGEAEVGNLLRGHHIKLHELCQLLEQAGSDTAGDIVEEELARSPHVLHHAAEHPQGEHVEEEVCQVAVHEHIGEQLVEVEVARKDEVEAKNVVQPVGYLIAVARTAHEHGDEKHHDVHDEQAFCNKWYFAHHSCQH